MWQCRQTLGHAGFAQIQLDMVLPAPCTHHALLKAVGESLLGPDPAGGFRLTGIKITVRGQVDGLDNDAFLKAAEAAKAGCPISKALTGTTITLDAALA